MTRRPRLHCELGPVLVNRTAVYRLCRALPRELEARGFAITCSALLARLDPANAEPGNGDEERTFRWSQRWLHWAIEEPAWFLKARWATGPLLTFRHGRALKLFLDP